MAEGPGAQATLRLERDMRVFVNAVATRVGVARAVALSHKAINRAATYKGEPSSLQWFLAWSEVLEEDGTDADRDASAWAYGLVKKLWDSGL